MIAVPANQTIADLSGYMQGDVVELLPTLVDPDGGATVVIVSQTCDVVQRSKPTVTVAAAIRLGPDELPAVRKGRRPMMVPVHPEQEWAADMSSITTLPKARVAEGTLVVRPHADPSSPTARALGVLIGRVFSRFPFPDEVHPVFAGLKDKIRSKAGSTGPLGRMLDMVHELRVGTEDWEQRPLRLRVYLLVKQSNLILSEDADPNFALTSLEGMSPSESLENLTLASIFHDGPVWGWSAPVASKLS